LECFPYSTTAAAAVNVVRKTDDVNTFLQTVDLAGVPQGMLLYYLLLLFCCGCGRKRK